MDETWTGEPAYADPDPSLLGAAEEWLARIDPQRLRALVSSIPGPRSRIHAPEAMAQADALIADAWRSAGWRVGTQRLRYRSVRGTLDFGGLESGRGYLGHTYRGLSGANLVAIAEGSSDEAIAVVAHHDTVRESPGADDNAAGVAALLELASRIGERRFHRTVVLATPDFEEIGLIGSRALVRWLRSRYRLRGAIVFDPIGYMDPSPGSAPVPPAIARLYPGQAERVRERGYRGDSVVALYRRRSRELAREWARCLAATIGRERVLMLRDPLDLPLVGPWLRLHPFARNFSRSDHVNFWNAGLPAILVTDTANFRNPHYHRPTDTADTLDYETLARITAATGLTVERLASADPRRGS